MVILLELTDNKKNIYSWFIQEMKKNVLEFFPAPADNLTGSSVRWVTESFSGDGGLNWACSGHGQVTWR